LLTTGAHASARTRCGVQDRHEYRGEAVGEYLWQQQVSEGGVSGPLTWGSASINRTSSGAASTDNAVASSSSVVVSVTRRRTNATAVGVALLGAGQYRTKIG